MVRRYLLLQEGHPCTEMRRAESERILRAQPFIADAAVVAYSDGPNSVLIEVTTVDEISLIVDGAVSGNAPHVRVLRLGDGNLFGAGLSGTGRWEAGRGFRDGYGIRLAHYQIGGRPYQTVLEAGRKPIGHDRSIQLSHPYLTDLQRVSWRVNYGMLDGYGQFRRPGDTLVALPLRRSFADIGGVVRIRGPGLLWLLGGSLSHESDNPAAAPVLIGDGQIMPDTSQALMDRYTPHRQTRLNALVGFRRLRFMRVTGFDALDGVQDVRKGVQFSGLIGAGFDMLDRRSEEGMFVSAALYGGAGTPASFAALETGIEAHRDPDDQHWRGVLASARVGWYARPFPRHTFVTSAEWSAGWRSIIPFQLTFAERDGGLRGFRTSQIGGGRRFVMRLEDRYLWGGFRRNATIGLAGFVDAGKLWAGDAPFGINSRLSASAGVALLAAIPPRSQRLVRLEVAYPLNPDVPRRFDVRLTAVDAARFFWREPRDVRTARAKGVPTNVFSWP